VELLVFVFGDKERFVHKSPANYRCDPAFVFHLVGITTNCQQLLNLFFGLLKDSRQIEIMLIVFCLRDITVTEKAIVINFILIFGTNYEFQMDATENLVVQRSKTNCAEIHVTASFEQRMRVVRTVSRDCFVLAMTALNAQWFFSPNAAGSVENVQIDNSFGARKYSRM